MYIFGPCFLDCLWSLKFLTPNLRVFICLWSSPSFLHHHRRPPCSFHLIFFATIGKDEVFLILGVFLFFSYFLFFQCPPATIGGPPSNPTIRIRPSHEEHNKSMKNIYKKRSYTDDMRRYRFICKNCWKLFPTTCRQYIFIIKLFLPWKSFPTIPYRRQVVSICAFVPMTHIPTTFLTFTDRAIPTTL